MKQTILVLTTLTFLALAFAPLASAHASQNSSDGKVRITWGWHNEPAYAGEKVSLDLIIRDATTLAGIGGITPANITELSLHYGEDEFELGNITAFTGAKSGAFAGPGNYSGANKFYLTKAGIYTLHIKGTIAGSEVDLEIPGAHETHHLDEIAFPAVEGSDDSALEARVATLETEIAALKAQIKTQSETPATVVTATPTATSPVDESPIPAVGFLAVAVGIVAAALILRRK